ncbi:ABC transporter substrate-binding protein [Roseomonas sp. NAR14]|uniref:ABC transporter substrate-binding protein n=1 Tax=Roseomonas acroporae TaxID=2937791 RepID=A0A9X2BZG7_9PROT|nr:ABC transporter substrate-binding protein [Roseomonas acroporae]MCK8787005.1 ABC transporter substrate-binding protein [Roseomonas acroporae]
MQIPRRAVLGAAAALPFRPARAQSERPGADNVIRIGVLTDLSGPYRDVTGPTSVACAKLAVDEFTAANPEIRVELISGDHLNKPDTAVGIAREWFDRRGVDVVTDVGNSAAAIALNSIVRDKDRIQLNTSAGTAELTGRQCSPNTIHWSYDTWCLANAVGRGLTRAGRDTWYFIAADYAFGKAIQGDATPIIQAAGGRVVGSSAYPFPGTTDFSAFLVQAQASRAKVLAFANAGDDLVNCVRQAQEFGLIRQGVSLAAMVGSITVVIAVGLPTMQGVTMSETFYWDLNERTRAFTARMRPRLPAGVFPNYVHAGAYSGVWHYLKAVKELGVARAKASGRAVIERMKAMPTDDDVFGPGRIREDGRKIHPAYLLEVKKPGESRYPGDVMTVRDTIPAEEAFRPMSAGGCPLVRG